jgi:hypothetical protein
MCSARGHRHWKRIFGVGFRSVFVWLVIILVAFSPRLDGRGRGRRFLDRERRQFSYSVWVKSSQRTAEI